jgi:murein L,D-transpeptidase YafK
MVISKEDMTIKALDTKGRVIYSFPIAVGKNFGNKKVKGDMKTPEGIFSVQEINDASG